VSDFFRYLTFDYLLQGALITLQLTVYSFLAGLVGGVLLAAVQLGRVPIASVVIRVFVIVTRGTPVLLQLIFVYDVLPGVGIRLSAFATAVVVLGVNTSSYFSEVIRGAVTSLDHGQIVAAESLGMNPSVIARRIIAPQAIRIALPSLANQVIVLTLTSSLASVISVPELTLRSQEVASATFQVIAVYSASGFMYLVITSFVAAVQMILEDFLSLDPHKRQHGWVQRWGRRTRELALRSLGFMRQPHPRSAMANPAKASTAAPGESLLKSMLLEIGNVHLTKAILADETEPLDLASRAGNLSSIPMLDVKGLKISYSGLEVLRGLDFSVKRGEVVVIMGVSGCGKSTLLRCIARLERLDAGTVLIEGEPFGVDPQGRSLRGKALAKARAHARIAMVFQHFELFTHLTARDNVSAALRFVYQQGVDQAHERAVSLLDSVGLGTHVDHLPAQLSGGQQQRAAIARALAISPRVILLDEPTSALDPLMVHEVLTVLRGLASLGMTMVIVTHEIDFAREVADQVVFMQDGQIVETGSPEQVLENPKEAATRAFLRILEK
jgi:polar amino acid transport system permease protein